MKYVLDRQQAAYADAFTINEMKVPSVVLMERAALFIAEKTAEAVCRFNRQVRIAAVCGIGNNGADGIAAARILTWQGIITDIIIVGNEEHASKEFLAQKEIAVNSGMNFVKIDKLNQYEIIIDALFGTGLSRDISGDYARIIEDINAMPNVVISVDIPSGIDGTNGKIRGVAVKAAATVTFGYNKKGLMLYPGKDYAGDITVGDIGLCPKALENINPAIYFTRDDVLRIPKRLSYSNKGSYGRTLVIAGSQDMSGAAYLSAGAAYRCGCGLVEVVTHDNNTEIIKKLLPEAIVTGYNDDNAVKIIESKMNKADIIILGPGLSTGETAVQIADYVMSNGTVPLIIDADALNIISKDTDMLKKYNGIAIITPHIGEMTRLSGMTKEQILEDIVGCAHNFAIEHNVICALKDAVTIVSDGNKVYINNSGCAAMSKAGMGDVLTGTIAGMLSLEIEPLSAAAMGVYVHGLAGEEAVYNKNEHTLLASDLLSQFGSVLKYQ